MCIKTIITNSLAGLTGILFAHCSDVAYSAMRIWQATGFTIGFAMAEILSFNSRLWVLLATAILATLCSVIIELTTQSKEELLPCVYRKRTPRSNEKSESAGVTIVDRESERNEPINEDHSIVTQNPVFVMYQGRRPSAMSNWSSESLDGAAILPSTSVNTDSNVLHQNGQIPKYHQPSTDSMTSGTGKIFPQNEGQRQSAASTDNSNGTLPVVSVGLDPAQKVRVLSPIEECEGNEDY